MNQSWTKSFEFAFERERVWVAFGEIEGPVTDEPLTDAARTSNAITELVEYERVSWESTTEAGDRSAMTVTFESIDSGTRVIVTRFGFGDDDPYDVFYESHMLGWTEGMADLASYLETGVSVRRHLQDRCALGIVLKESSAGLRVVDPGSWDLQRGDLVLAINGATLYRRSEVWFATRLIEAGTPLEITYARDGTSGIAKGVALESRFAVVGELGLGPRIETS